MKKLKVNYKLSREEYMEIQTYYMMRQSNIVKLCLVLFGIGMILFIAGLILGNGVSGAWILVVFPFPYLIYVVLKIRNIAYGMYRNDIKEWEVEISETKIKAMAIKQKKQMETPWEGIYKIWQNSKYLYLFFSKSVYLAIPMRSIEDKDLLKEMMLNMKT